MAGEVELARGLVRFFDERAWDVYQEVTCGGRRADIVATQGPVTAVVEVKTSLSMALFEQAAYWRQYAHRVWIATPRYPAGMQCTILRLLGIGAFVVSSERDRYPQEAEPARLRRRVSPRLRKALRPEHKTWAEAGNATSSYFSPWKATCRRIRELLVKSGPVPLREAIDAIDHHYRSDSTARSSMRKWIELGLVEGVAMRREGREVIVYAEARQEGVA